MKTQRSTSKKTIHVHETRANTETSQRAKIVLEEQGKGRAPQLEAAAPPPQKPTGALINFRISQMSSAAVIPPFGVAEAATDVTDLDMPTTEFKPGTSHLEPHGAHPPSWEMD